ncbi:Spo0E family sporulation regulatory protein-aspartic acid phosphatase [Clostridium sp. SYSU_GA19001]|uniref:Spo0E family sporulation regulatory protein-aspartic acid phosphatase n=1 Tax=Clostridium caldaquaticum TaxID=2940653 RepID=UPI00207743D3|nr:Spo0E family sporulation regulatory protein-aspartic acid phosphatase [Clostridium caldaquaticum]MCM8710859.1 Spo0E family sporulation regulatory protein-aspartic acid phosphatase [Clostridium caldaquaticum]
MYEELKREKKKLEDMIETGYENLTNEKILKQSEILDKLIAAYQKLNMQNFKHKE